MKSAASVASLAMALSLGTSLVAHPAHATGASAPGAVSARTLRLPDGPGSVRGLADAPSVDQFSGQVHYSIPLELPHAARDFAPTVELSYAGELGNGPVGVGWTLPQAAIRRSLRKGVPDYTSADALELVGIGPGGRLIAVGDGTWRLEGQGQSIKIERDGDGYRVTDIAGRRYRLGTTAAARQSGDGKVSAWLLEEVTDLGGQKSLYTYVRDQNEVYLESIKWGAGDVFELDVILALRNDRVVNYRRGFRVETAKRVQAIEVRAAGKRLRRYELSYDESLPVSRVHSVRMLGMTNEDFLPTLTFDYGSIGDVPMLAVGGADDWMLNQQGVSFADVDGDGLADLLRIDGDNQEMKRNLGGHFAPTRQLTGAPAAYLSDVQLMDLDGDVRPEMVLQVDRSWVPFYLSPTGWQEGNAWPGSLDVPFRGPAVELADLDGDGRTDSIESIGEGLFIRMNGPEGLGAPVFVPPISATSRVEPGDPNVRFRDVNGDGLADAVWMMDSWMTVFLGRGDGTFAEQATESYPWGDQDFQLSDVHLVDLNRDGLIDIVRFAGGYAEWYRGLANQTFEGTPRLLAPPQVDDGNVVIGLADVNGNGSEDVIWSSAQGMWALDLAGPTSAGMLTAIHNGLGKTVTLRYEASSTLAMAAELAGDPWIEHLPVSIPVASRYEIATEGLVPTRITEYLPRDGFWDRVDREFGGFLKSTRTERAVIDARTLREETSYERGEGANRVLRGRPKEIRVSDGTGRLLKVTENDWVAATVAGLPTSPLFHRAAQTETREYTYEGATTPVMTRVHYDLDDEGRVAVERRFGAEGTDRTGDEAILERTYASDPVTWVRDVVCEEKLEDGAGHLLHHKRHFFGDETTELALCKVGKGWARSSWEWLAADGATPARWVERSHSNYDARGNTVLERSGGETHVIGYDPRGLFPVSESVAVADQRSLTWSTLWDETLGVATSMTDPAGVTTTIDYDGLGRPIKVATAGQPAHLLYDYQWSGSMPRTFVRQFDGPADAVVAWPGTWRKDAHWRETVSAFSGSGEQLYSAIHLEDQRWLVSTFEVRDDRGDVVLAADPFYAAGVAPPVSVPATQPGQRLTRDALGRVTRQTFANGKGRSISYAPLSQTTSADGSAPVTFELDGAGHVRRATRVVGGQGEVSQASYDPAGRVTRFTLANGATQDFSYDQLGRLVRATSPDFGERRFRYDDDDHMLEQRTGANDVVSYAYDGAGRLTTQRTGTTSYTFHYDVPRDGTTGMTHTNGRLAWVEEPTGTADLGYDAFGRRTRFRRTIEGVTAEEHMVLSPGGLVTSVDYDDGFTYQMQYDAAGRATAVGDLWQALEQDAGGHIRSERSKNGVVGTTELDEIGLAKRVRVERGTTRLLDVQLTRNAFNAVESALDSDGRGLNHSASFRYDEAARLVGATIGGDPATARVFEYGYDSLQNLRKRRMVQGVKPADMLAGVYNYGENGAGPRQLTSVRADDGTLTSLSYDGAGRQLRMGAARYTWNGFDQLTSVDPGTGQVVEHQYGFDGLRLGSKVPGATPQRWFTDHVTQRGDVRDYYITVGERVVAKVTRQYSAAAASTPAQPRAVGASTLRVPWLATVAFAFLLLVVLGVVQAFRRASLRPAIAALLAVTVLAPACTPGATLQNQSAALTNGWSTRRTAYFHYGFGAGPALVTDDAGRILDERRFEPFGAGIDEARENPDGSMTTGAVDYTREQLNSLNKPTEPSTGLSFHGARWMSPMTGQWLSPDPPARTPDNQLMQTPWDLHPYQYVRQNPITYWDPDGRAVEPYDWEPNGMPAPYYIGQQAHDQIGLHYQETHLGAEVVLNHVPLISILGMVGIDPYWGDPNIASDSALMLKPDIVNLNTGAIYEIKPYRAQDQARTEATMYVMIANAAGGNFHLGNDIAPGVHVVPGPGGYFLYWSPEPGVILYKYSKYPEPVMPPVPVKVRERAPRRAPTDNHRGFWGTATVALGVAAFIVWKAKGCVAGPVGCAIGAAF